MPIKKLDHVNFITQDMPATIWFYTQIIGLVHGPKLSVATEGMEYFYIPGQTTSILHVIDVKASIKSPQFNPYAQLPSNTTSTCATGPFDHFCLVCDLADYDKMIEKLKQHKITYETYCYTEFQFKQIWILDPNGIRVELNFMML